MRWFADLAGTLPRLEVYGMSIVVFDVATGALVGATSGARALVESELPRHLAELVHDGTIARPDLRRLRSHLETWHRLDDLEREGHESTHSWTDQLRIHRPGAGPLDLELEIVVHRRADLDAEAAVVTLWAGDERQARAHESTRDLGDLWGLYDSHWRMIAADPSFADIDIDPRSQLGVMAWLYVHPDDVPAVQPLAAEVMAGRLRTVSYSARLRAKGGRWLPTEIEVRRLEGVDGPLLLVIARYVNVARRMIHPGQLTARQLSVTAGLFDGLRVAQIAERHGVAVKTIRNQLAAIYDKLDVTGQVELLATYHRPPQPHPRAAAERDGPAADGPSSP
ncbi:MAG: LuxR C-terminal-related transcriptional regulator [Acidimicrobiales bacterium]